MSMAVALELRLPFLDHLLVDAVGAIAPGTRFAAGKKTILKAVARRLLPAEIIGRLGELGLARPFAEAVVAAGPRGLGPTERGGCVTGRDRIAGMPVAVGLPASERRRVIAALTWSFALVAVAPRVAPRMLAVGLVALAVLMPVAALKLPPPQVTFEDWRWLPNSGHHRLTIWNFVARHVAEKPVLGWGMDVSCSLPGGEEEIPINRHEAEGRVIALVLEPMLPLHPHNAILQWWLELGAPGAALLLAAGALPGGRWERAAATGALVGGLMVSA